MSKWLAKCCAILITLKVFRAARIPLLLACLKLSYCLLNEEQKREEEEEEEEELCLELPS